ncbi:MAG: hypothetical protein OES32_10970 [Acidobacteriota bacterium]|nr:hypothetical protein [Acidobacteriota bacterium]MDH3524098.1 hypothetical protein [Acidobacteriota bacterium]
MKSGLPETLEVLYRVVGALDELEVPYHLGGSFASSIHGIPRQTQDIDLVVELDADDAARLVELLASDFYGSAARARQASARQGSFNLVHLATGVKVDLFVRGDSDFDRMEFSRRQAVRLAEAPTRETFVKSAEDTILRKLLWYRAGGESSDRQWGDVLGILEAQGAGLDRDYLTRWSRALALEDLLARAERSGGSES